jgi:hypothetical protein
MGDTPSPAAVAAAVKTWSAARRADDQIAQVVRTILLSPEFAAAERAKVRRPLALVAAFARATGLDLMPAEPLTNALAAAGQRLFGWPAPTGLPDLDDQFLGANSMRQRWGLLLALGDNVWGTGEIPAPRLMPMAPVTPRTVLEHFVSAMHGAPQPPVVDAVLAGLGAPPDQPLGDPAHPDVAKRVARFAALAAMAPEFQVA